MEKFGQSAPREEGGKNNNKAAKVETPGNLDFFKRVKRFNRTLTMAGPVIFAAFTHSSVDMQKNHMVKEPIQLSRQIHVPEAVFDVTETFNRIEALQRETEKVFADAERVIKENAEAIKEQQKIEYEFTILTFGINAKHILQERDTLAREIVSLGMRLVNIEALDDDWSKNSRLSKTASDAAHKALQTERDSITVRLDKLHNDFLKSTQKYQALVNSKDFRKKTQEYERLAKNHKNSPEFDRWLKSTD